MITDQDTNFVYFSAWVKKFSFYEELCKELDNSKVPHNTLPFTKDYWIRDYMPIQFTPDKYLQYVYNPDYLQKDANYITNPTHCCHHIGINTIQTNIILDGGNVIKCKDAIIMTNKIFKENKSCYTKIQLINELEKLFQAEIVIIPWDRYEVYGHADGMVRYIGNNCVLLNNYKNTDRTLKKELLRILSKKFEIIELEYHVAKPSIHNWIYINYLQVGALILFPSLNIPEDQQAYEQISCIFPSHKIKSINISKLVIHGGGLNCITWNIYKSD